MIHTLDQARAAFTALGLHVKLTGEDGLWIAATVEEISPGIRMSRDASVLLEQDGRWVALFPSEGSAAVERAGSLSDLVDLIKAAYEARSRSREPFETVIRSVLRARDRSDRLDARDADAAEARVWPLSSPGR